MATYTLALYWWFGDDRRPGGEYRLEADDNAAAIATAHAKFDEHLALTDQCAITDEDGKLVWQNEWPIPPEGRKS